VKEKLVQAQPDGKVPWETLCLTAKNMNIDLQSHELWAPSPREYLLYGAGVSEVEVNTLTGETRILSSDLLYDSGKSLNPAVDIGQVEGAFVLGIGFFLTEETVRDAKGKLLSDGTWTYKPPTIDTIPREFNVELFKSPAVSERVLSSKASGEPPLLLSGSVHSAIRNAVTAARKDYRGANVGGDVSDVFILDPPATMDKVKKLCGLDNVERYLCSISKKSEACRGKII
jgi:xanthine dehydrogenase molybdopterin-binding subunit B